MISCDENAVESTRPADRGDGGAEGWNVWEIEQVGPDQGSEAPADIGERSCVAPGNDHGGQSRRDRGREYWDGDADALDGGRQIPTDSGDDQDDHQPGAP